MVRRAVQQPRPHSRASGDPARVGRALAPRARQRSTACSTSPTAATPSERLDVFTPKRPGAPVLVYIHGGYWRALDKRDQSLRRAAVRRRRRDGRAAELRALPGGHHRAHRAAARAGAGLGLAPCGRARRRPVAHRRRRPFGRRPPGGDDAGLRLARRRARPAGRSRQGRARRLRRLRARAAAPRAVPGARHRARWRDGARSSARRRCRRRAAASSRSSAATRARSSCARTRSIAEAWGARAVPVVRAGARPPSHERAARARRPGSRERTAWRCGCSACEARDGLRAAARAPPAAPAGS